MTLDTSPRQVLPSFWLAWTIVPLLLGPIAFVLVVTTFGGISQGRLSLVDVAGSFQTIYGFGSAPALIFGLPAAWYLRRTGQTSFGAFAVAGLVSGLVAGCAMGLFISLLNGASFLVRSGAGFIFWGALFGSVSGLVWSILVRVFAARTAPDANASQRLGTAILAIAATSWVVSLIAGFSLAVMMSRETAAVIRVCFYALVATQVLAIALLAALAWFEKVSIRDWMIGGAVAGLVATAYALNVPSIPMRFSGSPMPILAGGIAFGVAFGSISLKLFRAARSLSASPALASA